MDAKWEDLIEEVCSTKKQKSEELLINLDEETNVLELPNYLKSFSYKSFKLFKDSIHESIEIPKIYLDIIDHPLFQRLRNLKQLGVTNFVYMGATHTRFEHSLGVGYLAKKYLNLLKKHDKSIECSQEEILLVGIAGLCHDLGHGPFSHTFEKWINKIVGYENWHHENFSCQFTERILNDSKLDFDSFQIQFIQDLIKGKHKNDEERMFLYQIVSNSETSIDVDKFDYLMRDGFYTGFKVNFDYKRIMKISRVMDGNICFYEKDALNIYNLFYSRSLLHTQVYNHKTTVAIELMLYDILNESNSNLKIAERPLELLGDDIFYEIKYSKSKELEKAKSLIKRLETRELYKLVAETLLPQNIDKNTFLQKFTTDNLVQFSSDLKSNDLVIYDYTVNHALKDKNPISNIHFFKSWESTESSCIKNDDISFFLPKYYSENHIRIYVKDSKKYESAKKAIQNFSKENDYNFSIY